MKKSTLALFVLVFGAYLLFRPEAKDLNSQPQPSPSPITQETAATESGEVNIFAENTQAQLTLTATQSGQTALELLAANAEIETQDFGTAGVFVNSINGTTSDDQHYWAFYVNDEYAQQGVSQTILESGDQVKFVRLVVK